LRALILDLPLLKLAATDDDAFWPDANAANPLRHRLLAHPTLA